MITTAICVSFFSAEARQLEELAKINKKIYIKVFHQRGDSDFDPHYDGWGRIGDINFYHVFLPDDTAENIRRTSQEIIERITEK